MLQEQNTNTPIVLSGSPAMSHGHFTLMTSKQYGLLLGMALMKLSDHHIDPKQQGSQSFSMELMLARLRFFQNGKRRRAFTSNRMCFELSRNDMIQREAKLMKGELWCIFTMPRFAKCS
jgi:hypothetical protein